MTQTASNWLTWLGSGGLLGLAGIVGTYTTFLIKKHIALLEQANQNLEKENRQLKELVGLAEQEKENALNEVDSLVIILEKLRESDIGTEDAARLRRVLGGFQRLRSMQERSEDYKHAARWLDYRKESWGKEASRIAIQEHESLIPKGQRPKFQQDITGYLTWVYTSLYVYEHPDAPLSKFVSEPAIKSPFPYTTAFLHILNKRDKGDLTIEQSRYLDKMLEELLNKLPKEFKNS